MSKQVVKSLPKRKERREKKHKLKGGGANQRRR